MFGAYQSEQWLVFLIGAVVYFAVTCGFLWLTYFFLTLPLRRNERARLFLDLIELGLRNGRTPEETVVGAASSRDQTLGVRFHLLAAHIETGKPLAAALDAVPRLLPPEAGAMLRAGEQMGDVGLVLPACKRLLRDGVAQLFAAGNYLLLLTFAITPLAVYVPFAMRWYILPSYSQVFMGMETGASLPAFSRLVFNLMDGFSLLLLFIVAFLWVVTIAYVGGPRLREFLRKVWPGGVDRFMMLLPWRRKRMKRDFTALLALLLDARVPESEAVRLAGDAMSNRVLRARAQHVGEALARGESLPQAIEHLDRSGEVRWRLSNALHSGRDFVKALAGWHHTLEAEADQQEQAAAQIVTTGMVLLNGLIVGSVIIAVFLLLIQIIQYS